MYTILTSKKKSCGCQCKTCHEQFSRIFLADSLLSAKAVPGGVQVPSTASGNFSLVMTDKPQFYVHVAVQNYKNSTMSHLHLYNRKNPKENGPIVLFLTHTMNNPIPLINGDLVARMFTTSDFEAPYKNMPFSQFQKMVMDGQLYFNAHTTQNPNGELAAPVRVIQKWG